MTLPAHLTVLEHGGSRGAFRELFSSVHFEAFLQQCKLLDEWNRILLRRVRSLYVVYTYFLTGI